jgi:cysteine desulfuration protein SufE
MTISSLDTTLEQLMDDFSFFEGDWEARYTHLIELGKKLPAMPDALKTEQTIVQGCMSQVWLVVVQGADGRFHLQADSDAHIVRGLVAVLLLVFDGKTAAQIKATNMDEIFAKLGLGEHLSPNRRNGFYSMVGRVKALAG